MPKCLPLAHEKLTSAGLLHYETSNYARPGKHSRHNLAYWQGEDYLGLGPSAVSTMCATAGPTSPTPPATSKPSTPLATPSPSTKSSMPEAYRIERIALLLRTTKGLPDEYLSDSPDGSVEQLIANKLADIEDKHLRLINNGPMLVDAIAAQMLHLEFIRHDRLSAIRAMPRHSST